MQFKTLIIIQADETEVDRDEMWAALRDEVFKLELELEDGSRHKVSMMLEADN